VNDFQTFCNMTWLDQDAQGGEVESVSPRLVVEALPCGVIIIDADGRVVAVNRWVEQRLAFERDQLVGQLAAVVLPDWPGAPLRQGAAHPISLAATRQRVTARRADGSTIELQAEARSADERGAGLLLLLTDPADEARIRDAASPISDQVEFERIVAELATRFINLPADQIDDTVREALRRFGEALDLDRSTFYRILPDFTAVAPVGWQRAGVPPAPAPISIKDQFPWAYHTLTGGGIVCFSRVDEIPSEPDRAGFRAIGVLSSVTVPLSVSGRVVGAVGFNVLRAERRWPPDVVHRLSVFASAFGNLLARRESDEALERALEEAGRLKDQLHAENVYLRSEGREQLGAGALVGRSAAIRRVLDLVEQVAGTDSTVLLRGETGTGKELLATRIHSLSRRSQHAMVRVNCAAIPATLIESELFGREKGAFTGALSRQIGRFEIANHSTIFLDEIGDLPPEVQVKLLRVLEERQIERLGSPRPIRIDTRIIAATHRDLESRMSKGEFREDLFYRLNVFPIDVPPLRERADDIPLLVWRFVEEFARKFGKTIDAIPRDNMAALQRYGWPGNIRELRNIVERAMILATGPRLAIPLPTSRESTRKSAERLADVEREHVARVLDDTRWRIRGPGGAAERLGLRPTTLETRIARLGLRRPSRAG
jgi:transcriptional regulator with GAF, ATPase, and Fis domain